MKILICNLTALLSLGVSAQAASLTLGSGGISIKDKTGLLLTTGTVRVGYFTTYADNSAFEADLASNVPGALKTYLANNFVPLGEGQANTGTWTGAAGPLELKLNTSPAVGEPPAGPTNYTVSGGLASSTWTQNAANSRDATGVPRGSRLFLLIYNDVNIDEADGIGIFSATNWTVPTSTAVGTASLSLATIDGLATNGSAATEFYRGSQGSLVLGDFNPVPEPATFSVLALGAMVALRRKRR